MSEPKCTCKNFRCMKVHEGSDISLESMRKMRDRAEDATKRKMYEWLIWQLWGVSE